MSGSFLEIVELEDGTVALRRMDDEGEALVEIHFSQEVEQFLGEMKKPVVKAMISAGVNTVGAMSKSLVEAKESEEKPRVLH